MDHVGASEERFADLPPSRHDLLKRNVVAGKEHGVMTDRLGVGVTSDGASEVDRDLTVSDRVALRLLSVFRWHPKPQPQDRRGSMRR